MTGMPSWLDRIGHDLRGPLAPLQTAAYLLKSGHPDAAQQRELLDVIERQVKRLTDMVDEVGDWSLAHAGKLLGRRGDCDASLLLADALAGIAVADRKPPTVLDDGGPAVVYGDQLRLTQLLRTLLEFAMSRDGSAAPSVRLQAAQGELCIDVVDEGAASADDEVARLLQEPMDAPYDHGLGLRLLIANAIARAHGGSLVAESGRGGLRLQCRLPLASPQDG